MDLTGKQRRHLRSLGQRLEPAVRVGKGGLSDGLVGQINAALARQELVKVRLSGEDAAERQAQADALARTTGAEAVGTVGRSALLYRPNPDLPPAERLALP